MVDGGTLKGGEPDPRGHPKPCCMGDGGGVAGTYLGEES